MYGAQIQKEDSLGILDATRTPVSRSKGQRSGSPGPLMLTHIVHHIFRMAKPKNFKLGTQMEDDDQHQLQPPRSPRSKFKVSHVISLSRVGPIAQKSRTNSRSITKIDRMVPHDTCYIVHQFQGQKVKGQDHRPTNADTKCALSSER